jgi:hypothetical protein
MHKQSHARYFDFEPWEITSHKCEGPWPTYVLRNDFFLLELFVPGTILTSWNWAFLKKPPIMRLLKNFQTFYGNRSFITMFTRTCHWSLSWGRWIKSVPSILFLKHQFLYYPPPTARPFLASLSFWLSHQNLIRVPLLPIPLIYFAHLIFLDLMTVIFKECILLCISTIY